jgi:hypothetical protein
MVRPMGLTRLSAPWGRQQAKLRSPTHGADIAVHPLGLARVYIVLSTPWGLHKLRPPHGRVRRINDQL